MDQSSPPAPPPPSNITKRAGVQGLGSRASGRWVLGSGFTIWVTWFTRVYRHRRSHQRRLGYAVHGLFFRVKMVGWALA
jgi:hypothetical protein